MDKQEEILLNEPEVVETKPSKKIKYAIGIIASTLVLATVATLLIGHFKFDWFKNDNYKIDANIKRSVYQADYFSEKKTTTTEYIMDDGKTEKREYIIDTNFVVFLTEKKDKMNKAALVLLSGVATYEGENHELPHLNMFDEKEIKELETNPDGSKYPIAIFTFDDDGKIEGIKVPSTMDGYHAEVIVDLIEKIIPRLSRNKKEDMSNGLEIITKKLDKKNIIVQNEAPKQYEEFKGSEHRSTIKTEIENEQITHIESESKVHLVSQPEEGQIMYGPKDFKFDIKSEIASNEVRYESKEDVELVNKIAEKFTLVDAKELLKSLKEKKEDKEEEVEEEKPVRQLGFPISASKTFNIASFDVLGQKVTVKYEVGISNSKAYNKLVIKSGLGTMEFGNTGCSGTMKKSYSYNKQIFTFTVPNTLGIVKLGCYAKGSLAWEIGFQSGTGTGSKYWASISGSLTFGAEIKAGWDFVASLSAFAEGTVFDAKGKVVLANRSVSNGSGFSLVIGKLKVGIKGCALGGLVKGEIWSKVLYNGYKVV